MTQLITQWTAPAEVAVLQTSRTFQNQTCFDIHPNNTTTQSLDTLVSEYHLPHNPVFMLQKHENHVIEYFEPPKSHFKEQADACFTRTPGVICAVMTADCLPVIMTDIHGSFVAAVHCGWRSLSANILDKTISAINPTKQILAWFGPCIQQNQYEVDASFVTNYLSKHSDSSAAFSPIINNKSFASLYQMAAIQLNKLGITKIHQSRQCTFNNKDYFSWRENATPHRMSTMVWIKGIDQ